MYIILNLMDASTVFSNSIETIFPLSLFAVIQEYHYYLTFFILNYIFYHVTSKMCSLTLSLLQVQVCIHVLHLSVQKVGCSQEVRDLWHRLCNWGLVHPWLFKGFQAVLKKIRD